MVDVRWHFLLTNDAGHDAITIGNDRVAIIISNRIAKCRYRYNVQIAVGLYCINYSYRVGHLNRDKCTFVGCIKNHYEINIVTTCIGKVHREKWVFLTRLGQDQWRWTTLLWPERDSTQREQPNCHAAWASIPEWPAINQFKSGALELINPR